MASSTCLRLATASGRAFGSRRAARSLCTASNSKVFPSAAAAVEDLEEGAKLLVGGFGLTGVPTNLLQAINQRGVGDLTVVSSNVGTAERGLGPLFASRQISKLVGSYVGENDIFERQYLGGEIEVELVPMGTLAERMRAAGAGIPAFYTATGVGTLVQHGNLPMRYATDGSGRVELGSSPRKSEIFGGKEYIMEEAITGDYALVKAWRGDTEGNLVYRKTSRNHNPAIATAGKITVAEVEELVPAGVLQPDDIHTPGIYVDRIVQGAEYEPFFERLTHADAYADKAASLPEARVRIAKRAALELRTGDYVNLGIGIPTLVSNYVPEEVKITLQSENGMLGVGPFPNVGNEDADLVNAGKQTVTELDGASFFSADQSFANGDMANYLIPGKMVKGMGGAMDLVSSPARVIVLMEHCDKKGGSKVLQKCTLPLTGAGVVSTLITDLGVFSICPNGSGMTIEEIAPGVSLDDVRAATAADFTVPGRLIEMPV